MRAEANLLPDDTGLSPSESVALSSIAMGLPTETVTPDRTVSGVINLRVRQERLDVFSLWCDQIGEACQSFPGFVARDVVQSTPRDGLVHVSILLIFENEHSLRRWETSEERRRHLEDAQTQELWDKYSPNELAQTMTLLDGNQPAPWHGLSTSAPPQKPSPPPKWKLGLIIWVCVTASVTAWVASGATPALLDSGWIGVESSIVISLVVAVIDIVYAQSELLMGLRLGPWSVDAWLKLPTVTIDPQPGKGPLQFLRIAASGACSCLNAGCGCFNPPPPTPPNASVLRRLERAEGRLEALRRSHNALFEVQMGAEELLNKTSDALPRLRGTSNADRAAVLSSTDSIMQQARM
ncbi:hypothetical protein AB1Y20_020003 [Prymnesium parvum]|uniref:ABM domain-containing protein n=1 Tax=Prymnesium parvum TaxID=97485 RepID=A0AB34JW03_PRYPA